MSKYCRSCGEPLLIETRLEDKLGSSVNVCLSCLTTAIRQIRKEDERRYYGLEGEIDI